MENTGTAQLDAALQTLREAEPDPTEVEKLAAATIEKRNNPHTFGTLFASAFGAHICRLCGYAMSNEAMSVQIIGAHPTELHVRWHNAMHRAGVEVA